VHLLEQQSVITVYHLTTKENKRPFSNSFAANKQKFAVSIFRLQKKTEVIVFR
jgi:hypothetical protein